MLFRSTEAEVDGLEKARQLALIRRYTGHDGGPYPTADEARAYQLSDHEKAILTQVKDRTIAGTPDVVRSRLEAVAAEFEVDELVVITVTADFESRLRSYELLARAFELN